MEKNRERLRRIIYCSVFLLLTLVEVYIAVFVRDNFVRPYVGDILVVIVIYFFICAIRPESSKWLPIYIFLFAVCVEVSQYFKFVRFLGLDGNRAISVILGGVFDWSDILCYGTGCIIVGGFSLFNFNRI